MVSPPGSWSGVAASVAAGGQGAGVVLDLVSVEAPSCLSPQSPVVTLHPILSGGISFLNWKVSVVPPRPFIHKCAFPNKTGVFSLTHCHQKREI